MAKAYVDNRNLEFARTCTSADGEHVQVNPGARKMPIDDKFLWKMHPDIALARGSSRTFKTAEQEKQEAEQAEHDRLEKLTDPDSVSKDSSEDSPK